ncbi:ATP-dependent RNA helicase HrpA [Chromobacterium haemolyticum]|uniref:ATP-dependent RNA helicase HrpA n=1 Tax=Chromobacterium haemolyticum TaxID=394935 RepID=A0ABS3GN92_9NEIS|nr:ATP-dependent RNA helicase HrpA [Chromobacterium haemolyticum]MBK0415263.1 ATP-dependent RNA helicase HrpA [Chromobacterium haemolyticum]MBO0416521.1 ATP-dependent RNA helicase HrpA [Chromobacterium haemolyticum]MBO0499903.1 ATP-dependent RNA helicase HrpA [Chromobacterium haemolyticum]
MTAAQLLAQLKADLPSCLIRDRHVLRRKLSDAAERLKKNQPADKQLADIQAQIERSAAKVAARRAHLPKPDFDDALPVNQKLADIKTAIERHQVVIICGETGSGKTTQLPKICLELGRGVHGLIGHTQPRRLAARSVASRIAQELKSTLGEHVGFKVRFTDKLSEKSVIKLMTDGIMLAETQTDRYLEAYDTIIIDEAHERSLNIDFLLGYLKQLLPRRPDLKVIVTSATIDADRFSRHFDGAPVIEVSGRTYPVEVRYRPLAQRDEDEREVEMEGAIVDAVDELSRQGPGDMLVFLPGEREIRETAEKLRKAGIRGYEILPLFARLSNEDQQKIFKPSGGRRIVLATNVAETSLTVPGIKYVIDTGQARINRYSPRAKVEQLQVEKISQAAARQRAGRCGRVEAGICVRLYSEDDFNQRPAFTDPEIVRSNLAAVILRMAALRLGKVDAFPFLEAPSSRLIADGYQVLTELGAVDDKGELTSVGKELARIPVDPKVGRLLLAGRDFGCVREVLIIAAALSVQDPRERPFEAREAAERAQARFNDEKSDFLSFLHLWDFFSDALKHKKSNRLLINTCHEHFLSHLRLREWRELHAQLADIASELGLIKREQAHADAEQPDAQMTQKKRQQLDAVAYENLHKALVTGLIGNLGMKNQESDDYQGTRGVNFHVFPGSGLKKAKPKWLVAAELVETTRLYARCVAKIEPEWVEKLAPHLVKYHYFDPHWEKSRGEVVASERVTLYGLTLVPRRPVSYGRIAPVDARELFIRGALVNMEYVSNAPFFQRNQQLIREVEQLEHKARRQDVLVDEEALFAFYSERIPAEVVDATSFEAWRKEAEKTDAKLLHLTREELMRHAAQHVTENQFPEWLELEDGRLKLRYRFEPNHPLDGVTLDVPLAILNRLQPAAFEWLVPGMVREKLQQLIKGLPKQIRRCCVPVPDFVTRFLSGNPDPQQPIAPQLARFILRETGGVKVDIDDFRAQELPAHLLFNFRVIDDGKQEIGLGRDLLALQKQFGQAAQLTFRDTSAEFERDEVSSWDFGELPESIQFARGRQQLTGYPALTLEQDKVAIRLFDTQLVAERHHRQGVIRLLQLQLKEQMKQLSKGLPGMTQLGLQLRAVANIDELLADAIACICDRAFIGDDALPRNEKAFNDQKTRARTRLPAVIQAVTQYLGQVAAEYGPLSVKMQKHKLGYELQQQLAKLVYKGFLAATPWSQLPHLPRYMRAMGLRMDKQPANPQRDGQRGAEIRDLWQKWETRVAEDNEAEGASQALLDFRWQIEELRVSLFAQELKTPYPVSAKRLLKLWSELPR